MKKVFDRAVELNIKFNPVKFQFMKSETMYLGLKFTKQGSMPDEERISAVTELKFTQNVKELQSVLGFFNFLRDIPCMSEISAPLRELLKK